MTRSLVFVLALLCVAVSFVAAACTAPSTITIPNQPALDSTSPSGFTGTGIIENASPTNENNTRLLQVVVSWSTVINRTVSLVSVGATHGNCDSHIVDNSGTVYGWKVIEDTNNCVTTLFAQYKWPQALYDATCAPNFQASNNGTNYFVSFDVYVTFTDHVAIERAGNIIWTDQVSNVIVPVVLTYPLTVAVSMANLRFYSANSISIDVALAAQTIQNSSPYHVLFNSLISRSFAVSMTSISYFNGSQDPSFVNVSASGAPDTFANTVTRIQHWEILIVPGNGKCQFDGYYEINVGISWTGVDEQGNALNASDNPIPNNTTATFSFRLDSQNFCGSSISNTIQAVMTTFIDAPAVNGGHTNNVVHTGFLQGGTVYFRAVVQSDNLPIKTVSLTNLESVQGSNHVALVTNGSPISAINYAPSSINNKPNNETDWKLTLDFDTFPIPQDASLTYTFNALLTVTYDSGLQKRMSLRQSSSTAGTAKATTDITVQRSAASAAACSTITLALLCVVLSFYALL